MSAFSFYTNKSFATETKKMFKKNKKKCSELKNILIFALNKQTNKVEIMNQKKALIKKENILVPVLVTQEIGSVFLDVVLAKKNINVLSPFAKGHFFKNSLN